MSIVSTELHSKKGFYVGDICYVLDDPIYHGIWGDKHDFEDGLIETEFGNFAVASTAYGDGEYYDEYGHSYGVDAGVLGIVPWEILEKQEKFRKEYSHYGSDDISILNGLGHFFEGTEADFYATGRSRNGLEDGLFEITIGGKSITIHTGEDEEEEDEYEDEYDYYFNNDFDDPDEE